MIVKSFTSLLIDIQEYDIGLAGENMERIFRSLFQPMNILIVNSIFVLIIAC